MSTPQASSPWKTLLPPAMVGTDKKPLQMPMLEGAVGQLLAQLQAPTSPPAQVLLQAAGVLTVCERAGQRPAAASTPASHGVAATDTLQQPLQDKALKDTTRWLLTDAPQRLQIDWFQQMAAAGWRLPATLLPLALDTAQRASALRPAVGGVLGERGRWLARHHSAWRYAAGSTDSAPPDTRWQEGTLAQRLQLLRQERQTQPGAARERLQASLADLPAKERAELLAVLQTGLSADDEALLTTLASQDRSRDVRQTARTLLVQLPNSAITQAAIGRLQACIQASTKKAGWTIAPPEAADPDWKNHGIDAERPTHERLGERAWWLYQLARQVPLAWWEQHTGMTPEALLQWARKGDWTEALVRAWWEVLRPAPVVAWCHAFLEHWPGKAMPESPAAVLALLSTAQREPYWQRTLESIHKPQQGNLEEVMQQIVAAYPPGQYLSAPLSQLLVEKLSLYQPRYYYQLQLADVCCVLHHNALAPLLALAQHSSQHEGKPTEALAQALRQQLPVLMARQTMARLPRA